MLNLTITQQSMSGLFVGFDSDTFSPRCVVPKEVVPPLVEISFEGEEEEESSSDEEYVPNLPRNVIVADSRPFTRSRGKTLDLPNVQEKTLERKRRT